MTAPRSRLSEALHLAAELHATQVRKGTSIPYVAHLMAVAALVLEDGGDEEQAIAAMLHDAVEDQGGEPTLARIRAEFGDRVADIVKACSDSVTTPKPPWRERKERYLAQLEHEPIEVRRVSAADKVHNARAILGDLRLLGLSVFDRFTAPREEVLWYYESLVGIYRRTDTGFLGDELARVVEEIRRTYVPGAAVERVTPRGEKTDLVDCCGNPDTQVAQELHESSHDSERVLRCGHCGAYWLWRMNEVVSFTDAPDDLTVLYWRLTEDEARRLLESRVPDASFVSGRPAFVRDRRGVRRSAAQVRPPL